MLLNFGAVDYICQVSINGKFIGENRGGYYPFTFDITNLIKIGKNEITVTVTDPTEKGVQARGKQTFKRGGIWYTPQSGIWQTVWLESVPESYIKSIKLTPNIDKDILSVEISYNKDITKAKITIYDNQKEIIKTDITGNKADIKLKDYKLAVENLIYIR